jgi:hypothetical protein
VIGQPVSVIAIEYDGNVRRGLTATCRTSIADEPRKPGDAQAVSAADVLFPEGSAGARHVAAYRRWLGLDPLPPPGPAGRSSRRHKAAEGDLDLSGPVELVALAVRESAVRCRILGSGREVTLRTRDAWDVVPGEIVTVRARKQWRYAGHPYLSGEVEGRRLDAAALGLVPLGVEAREAWDPAREYWGEEDAPLEEWARSIVARGPRPAFEMERVRLGREPDDPFDDAILQASELRAEDPIGARKLLMDLLAADLRCLDAHAHLGNFAFDVAPEEAIRHYEVGLRVGELSLGDGFDGLLPWAHLGNRPFLRCLHGHGLCLWRLGRSDEAAAAFERLLGLDPADHQGVRFLLPAVRAGERWEDRHGRA